MRTWNDIGLLVYVLMAVGTLGILGFDLWLRLSGRETITEFCRANPWAGWGVICAIQIGVAGLAMHFMGLVPIVK